ncbi:MAG TPA: phosphoribosylformylglycinamidine synthase subunit PurS, partial [Planctomycetaceae bacterium]|nr:phosphoribosylformylglycinamidine synthase subunit PurS [Planctomycetaceae bacterium]
MLWEVEIRPTAGEIDREGLRIVSESHALGAGSVRQVRSARVFLIETEQDEAGLQSAAHKLLVDRVVEDYSLRRLGGQVTPASAGAGLLRTVLFKPGVTDNVALSTQKALADVGCPATAVGTARRYWFNDDVAAADLQRVQQRLLANDAIERIIAGPLHMDSIALGSEYRFQLTIVPIRGMDDAALMTLSKQEQLYLSLAEMQTIRQYFAGLDRDPTDIELESVAQTWSEHCSHKTLKGRIRYRDEHGERQFENMLKETVFGATVAIREKLGADDWCVSVFQDNAGIVKFDETQNVCFKVETHNHPSAIEPYGGANTGIGGVIRDPLGTGMGARPILNTDVFCFAPPDT